MTAHLASPVALGDRPGHATIRRAWIPLLLLLAGCAAAPEAEDDAARRDRAFAYLVQAVDHQLQGRHAQAEADLQRAVRLAPTSPTIQRRLARTLLARGRREEGLTRLRIALALLRRDEGDGQRALLALAVESGAREIALRLADALATATDRDAREEAARVLARAGRFERVEQIYEGLAREASPGRAYRRHGDLLVRHEQWTAAARAYRRALASPIAPAGLRLAIARCEAAAGQPAEALAALRGARSVDRLLEARLLDRLGRRAEALRLLRQSLGVPGTRLELARLSARDDPAAALRLLDAVAPAERTLEHELLRGRIEHRRGRREAAREIWRRAAQSHEKNPLPLLHLAGSFQAEGRLDPAQQAYEQALLRAPDSGRVLHAFGRFQLEARRDAAMAAETLEQAARRLPRRAIWLDLSRAWLRAGHPAKSAALLRGLLARRQDALLWRELGIVQLALGDRGGALAAWRAALLLSPDPVLAARAAALALARKGPAQE